MFYDKWKLLAGVAIFILGMQFLAQALRALTGREAKLFLRKQTVRPVTAIMGGALVTGLVQSSSIVNLIVLGLVGAGTIPMANALAVTLGTNIGSTLNTWIIASVGFSLEIEAFALPFIAVAGIMRVMFPEKSRAYHWLDCLLGLGFLFYGLDVMSMGMEHSIQGLEPEYFSNLPIFLYPIIGLIITTLTQSSAATVALVLSALNAKAIDLHVATAIVLGAEVGTTIKLVIASAGKEATVKRVALGNIIFNIVTLIVIFVFLTPVNHFITSVIGITEPLLALATFQTLTNVVSILLFFPLLGRMARFLNGRFKEHSQQTLYIHKVPAEDEELAITALEQETTYFLKIIIQYCLGVFDKENLKQLNSTMSEAFSELRNSDRYQFIKQLHGDMYTYAVTLQNATISQEQVILLSRLVTAARNGMYAAKSIKDAESDITQLRNSGNDVKYQFYIESKETASLLLEQFSKQLEKGAGKELQFAGLVEIYRTISDGYNGRLQKLYNNTSMSQLSDIEVSTIINFNREIYSAFKSLVFALKELQLTGDEAKYFDEMPGFIR